MTHVLAVDIGNTNMTLGVFAGARLVNKTKLPTHAYAQHAVYLKKIKARFGQMPAMIERNINILVYMTQEPGVFETAGGTLTPRKDYAIAVKKGNDDLLSLVNSVISELQTTGELKRLAEKANFPVDHVAPVPAPTRGGTGAGTGSGGGTGGGGR